MRIMVTRRWITFANKRVETYSGSIVRALRAMGHEVVDKPKGPQQNYDGIDLVLDIDCGRDEKGKLVWQAEKERLPVPSAVMFIDSHGYPAIHRAVAAYYDHVFFAVWDKRDLFSEHPSAHWCPNFTDLKWFDGVKYPEPEEDGYDFGFFGSKGGLSRADKMVQIANNNGWTATSRQVNKGERPRWPATAEAMGECRNLFNHGQKHDGPNLRVMESMLMMRPLICDYEERSGMDKLFEPGVHYVSYDSYTYEGLERAMSYVMNHTKDAAVIAANGYVEVRQNHLVENRVEQILEVVNG